MQYQEAVNTVDPQHTLKRYMRNPVVNILEVDKTYLWHTPRIFQEFA